MSVSSCSTLLPEDEEGLESVHHHSATASGKSTRCTTSASSIDSRYTGASTSSSRLNATTQHSRAPSTPKSTTSTNSIRSDRSTSSSSGNRVSDHTRRHIASSCNPASPNGCNMQLTTGHKLLLRSNLPKINHMSPSLGVDVFSAKHPMIPKRYVPPWQLDMKNRARTLQIAQAQGIKPWEGHISYFLEGRERLNATSYGKYAKLFGNRKVRRCEPLHSPISRYNSSVLYYMK